MEAYDDAASSGGVGTSVDPDDLPFE
jgi:hypothetical protein